MGRREDALIAIQETVELCRQAAADRSAVIIPDLVRSLDNLSACLSDLGRGEEALMASREANDIRIFI